MPTIWENTWSCRAVPSSTTPSFAALSWRWGAEVTRPVISGIMGAFGAALAARGAGPCALGHHRPEAVGGVCAHLPSRPCNACTNRCNADASTPLPVGGRLRCRKPMRSNRCKTRPQTGHQPAMHKLQAANFSRSRPQWERGKPAPRQLGLPMGLNLYENLVPSGTRSSRALGFGDCASTGDSTRNTLLRRAAHHPLGHGLLSGEAAARTRGGAACGIRRST